MTWLIGLWGLMFFPITAPICTIALIIIIAKRCSDRANYNYRKNNEMYHNSEYYKQTGNEQYKVRYDKGINGEYTIQNSLQYIQGYKKFLFNTYLYKADGTTTEIDIIMIHESGIHIYESKNYSGTIVGSEKYSIWTEKFFSRNTGYKEYDFYNPYMQNSTHMNAIMNFLKSDYPNISYFSYIVFGNNANINQIETTSNRHSIIKIMQVNNATKSNIYNTNPCLTMNDIDRIYNKLYPYTQLQNYVKEQHKMNLNNF